MSLASVLINLAYVALLGSAFTRTLTWLRTLLVLGSAFFVVYGIVEGITSIIVWNVIIGTFHAFHVVRDERNRRSVQLGDDEVAYRDAWFSDLDDFDFNCVWSLGRAATVEGVIIADGARPAEVALILDGSALVEQGGSTIATLGRGHLVGEMSFVSGEPAAAAVRADGPVAVHRWSQRDLATLGQLNPAAAKAFDAFLARDLAGKAKTVSP